MIPMTIEADPNAELETWVKRCDRAVLERMYLLVFQQAQISMQKAAVAQEQLSLERGLPDKYREGVYSIKMVNGIRQPYYIASFDTIRHWEAHFHRYDGEDDQIAGFLRSLIE